MKNTAIGGAAALAALAVLIAAVLWRPSPESLPTPPAPAAPGPLTPAPLPTPPRAGTAPAAPEPSLAQQVDALIATHDPGKAYDAWVLLRDCATFNRDGDRLVFDQDEIRHRQADTLPGFRGMTVDEKRHAAVFCASMTERMRQSRIDYLAFAAQGGIAAAALEQAQEGPFGDRTALVTRPDDPLVREWKTRVQEQLARVAEEQGDFGALNYLFGMRGAGSDVFDKDPALAYRYGLAMGLIMGELQGPHDTFATIYAANSSLMTGMAEPLTAQERATALAAAQRIAAAARAQRQQARGAPGP